MLSNSKKLIVLGIDGIPPEALENLMRKGRLPNIQKIRNRGAFGHLRSTILPITPPAWAASYTGKNPAKTGIYGFYRKDPANYNWKVIDSRDIDSKTVWELVSDEGGRSMIIGSLVTMPRNDFNGILIGGFLDYEPQNGIYPESIKKIAINDLGYSICSYNEKSFRNFVKSIKDRFKAATYFLQNEKWDLMMVGFEQIEIAHHNLMGTSPKALRLYDEFDKILGEFMKSVPKGCGIMMYSDHGTKFYNKKFHLTSWLVKHGYLKVKTYDELKAMNGERERKLLAGLKDKHHNLSMKVCVEMVYMLDKFMRKHFFFIKKFLPFLKSPNMIRSTELNVLSSIYDYGRSKTYCYEGAIGNFGGLYINVKGRDADGMVEPCEEYEKLRAEIKEHLLKESAVKNVWKKEEIYKGPYLSEIFDIIVELNEDHDLGTGEDIDIDRITRDFKYSQHQIDGFIMVAGDGVEENSSISYGICDVMPTIMYMLGLAMPDDIDGSLMEGAFSEKWLANHPAKRFHAQSRCLKSFDYLPQERNIMEQKLKSLGYL